MEDLDGLLLLFLMLVLVWFSYSVPFPTKETWRKNKFLYIVMGTIASLTLFGFLYSVFDGVKSFFTIFIFW